MDFRKTSVQFCKLPLVIAIGSVFLASCSSNTAPVAGGTSTRVPVAQNEAVSNVPATDSSYSTSLLDDDSLAELENLLEATDMKMVEDDKLAIQQYGNLWDRMRAGFRMDQSYGFSQQQRIDAQKNWFITRQEYINRLTARASRYLYHTIREAERRNIPTELALLPVIESSYDPTGTSNAAAAGLWQFIPSTGRIYGLTQTPTYDGRRDVIESTRAAYDFLTSLYNQFGSWELALASYNAGPGRVQKAIDANRARGLPTDYWSLSLPTETMHYVPRFMAVAQIVKDTNQYSIALPAIANRQHFRSVPVNYGVSLYEVSQITGVSYDELKALNPALTNGRVDTSGPNRVIIPNQINVLVDSKLSNLNGNGGTVSGSTTPYTIPDSQYEVMAKSPEGLAEFASKARAPQQNNTYIAPNVSASVNTSTTQEPPISDAEKRKIESELATSNTLPTTSAQLTKNDTIVQEPPLSPEEKEFISQQIRQQSPGVGEVVSSVDGNIKLEAIQTQQSILEARGEEKRISFDRSTSTAPTTSSSSTQQQPATPPKPAGTRSVYTVQRGDTLVNIASRAGLNWRDIADWNQINPNSTLMAGTKLYLYNAQPIAPLGSAAKPDPSQSGAQPNTYIVRPGDTLIGTANRVGLSVSRLASYNGLSTNAQLRTGQKLWLIPGKVETSSSSTSTNSASAYKGKTQSYTVKRGEGLIALASRFNVSVDTLAAMNGLETNEQLLVGQRLTVPAQSTQSTTTNTNSSQSKSSGSSNSYQGETTTYTVKSGDTLIGIANKLGVSHTQIAEMNNISDTGQLLRGQKLKLPATKEQVSVKVSNEAVSYKVKPGDSLTSVANKYKVSVSDLAKANNVSPTANLIIGQTLTIPAGGSQPVSSQTSNQTSNKSTSTNTSTASKVSYTGTYKVKAGDGLINLAREYGVSAADLAAANGISATAGLRIGQTLKVPNTKSGVSTSSSNSQSSTSSSSSSATTTSGNYTVKSGDSLNRLASQHGLTVSQLASANGLSTTAELQIGQKITIPSTTTTYKVKSGDSLIGLAKKYGMTPQKFAELNGISSNTMLQVGQILKVPVQ
ncbi:lytic transglycosylase [Psychrobacter sp. FDAARGOS_221]|uniref:lytic transglycosylase n=1 Tax=Psychrobacter sp. FDAARGOS_221 TaxID=1975705 RepID=UPI000BB562D9|nr:LysM peptidoglycan-binding domain-containing protein [Psychrobacter sp. FDAARGOS_221]PNK59947.1 LysM peptidoglycan-binding domain-containing protein [Psychrobacter sp. FDAARGOS_221]